MVAEKPHTACVISSKDLAIFRPAAQMVIDKSTHCVCNFNKKTLQFFRPADKYIQECDEM